MTEGQRNNKNRKRFTQRKRGTSSANTKTNSTTSKNNNPLKTRELKFYLHDSAQRKTSESFNKIKEAIITKIQKTFEDSVDVVESLEKKTKKVYEEPDFPNAATEGTPEARARKDRMSEKKWEILFQIYQDEVKKFDALWIKTYALIWDSYCSKEVQVALKEMSDFGNVIDKNPLVLLERIETLMHTPERTKYPSLTTVEILANFLKCKQGEKESLIDYLSRFKSKRDIVFRIVGKKFLDGFAEQCEDWEDEWTDDQKNQFRSNELKKFLAVLFLRNADYSTYNELLVEYCKSYANKLDIYQRI